MPRRLKAASPKTTIAVLAESIEDLRQEIMRLKQSGTASLQTADLRRYNDPGQGELLIHHQDPVSRLHWFHDDDWVTFQPGFEVKMFGDTEDVVSGADSIVVTCVGASFDRLVIKELGAFVSTPSSGGTITVTVTKSSEADNHASTVIVSSTPITINPGNYTSYFPGTTQAVINPANARVFKGDLITFTMSGAPTGAKGLGAMVEFGALIP